MGAVVRQADVAFSGVSNSIKLIFESHFELLDLLLDDIAYDLS